MYVCVCKNKLRVGIIHQTYSRFKLDSAFYFMNSFFSFSQLAGQTGRMREKEKGADLLCSEFIRTFHRNSF